MEPTFTKAGKYQDLPVYLPVIKHRDGRREVLYGSPLSSAKTAKKYAALEIIDRREWEAKKKLA